VVREVQEPCAEVFSDDSAPGLWQRLLGLAERAKEALLAQGFPEDRILSKWGLWQFEWRVEGHLTVVRRNPPLFSSLLGIT
jgi:hypothetical protein